MSAIFHQILLGATVARIHVGRGDVKGTGEVVHGTIMAAAFKCNEHGWCYTLLVAERDGALRPWHLNELYADGHWRIEIQNMKNRSP